MTGHELLELAAKAADMGEFTHCELVGGSPALHFCEGHIGIWCPLEDDGDALRLAVKLRMDVTFNETDVFAFPLDGSDGSSELHQVPDPYAATRRAITRAAAEIGRKLT